MRIRIATLTLACLLTATAAMAQDLNRPNGRTAPPPVPDGTLGMALMSAAVNADASLNRSAGATGTVKLGTGTYEVDFVRDVTNCHYVLNTADTGFGTAFGFATAVKRAGNPNGIFVVTENTGAVVTDLPFQVIIFCPR